jgi:putative salt-induced outer membrane protein YdiY
MKLSRKPVTTFKAMLKRVFANTALAGLAFFSMAFLGMSNSASAQLPQAGNSFDQSSMFPAQGNPGGATGTLTGEPPPKKIWSGGAEAGLNGQSGNTDVFNLRLGWNAQRKTDDNLFTSDFVYGFAKQNGIETQNQALFNARDEILFAGSPWSLFFSTNIEYDKFRNYDFLVGVYTGLGYLVLDNGSTFFKLRAGAGAVRRFGGPDESWIPEAVLGYDFNHKFNDRQSFVHSLDYYPRIDKWSEYRIRARAAYEIVVDPASGTVFRIGAQDRFDSNPGPGKKRNDITYFASLMFKF